MIVFYVVASIFLLATCIEPIYTDYYDHFNYDYESAEIEKLPEITSLPQVITAKLGERITLDCAIKNGDHYVTMWQKKDMLSLDTYTPYDDVYSVLENDSLVIKNVQQLSGGNYTCWVLISHQTNISLTHEVRVEDVKITSLRTEDNNTNLNPGDTLVLTCQVDGEQTKYHFKWYFNENNCTPTGKNLYDKKIQTGSDTLTIENVNLKNCGMYRCLAYIGNTSDHRSIFINISDYGIMMASNSYIASYNFMLFISLFIYTIFLIMSVVH